MDPEPRDAAREAAGRLAELSPERRVLVERLLREKQRDARRPPTIPRRPPGPTAPCSFAQRRMWFLNQLAPGSPYYNEHHVSRLRVPLDAAVLERAINEIVRRHDALRTSFTLVDGEPAQVIAPALEVPLAVVDLRGFPTEERERLAARHLADEANRAFDVTRLPLLRTVLVRCGEADCILGLTMNHIVCDGWSMPVFFAELGALYEAFARGAPSPLPELPIQYADFAAWQRGWLRGEVLERQVGYWRRQLRGLPALELPGDRPRPPVPSYRGARRHFFIPAAVAARLQQLAHEEDATPFMVLLAAFKLLLARYSGQEEVVVGAPAAGRGLVELEPLIGFFVNSLVMRTDLSGNPSFREALRRVRRVALDAFAHQDVPFEKVVEELQPERDTARNPLFQVIFQYFTGAGPTGGLRAGAPPQAQAPEEEEEDTSAKLDLRLDVYPAGDGMLAYLEYSTDLFDPPTIAAMAAHLQVLLEAVARTPNLPAFELPLMDAGERERLVRDWSAPAPGGPYHGSVQALFERQVARTPNAVAVACGARAWSYRALNRRANRLAHRLAAHGVGPEVLVALSGRRGAELIVAILAVVKAGGAYLPLDPAWPAERARLAVRETGAALALDAGDGMEALLGGRVPVLDASVDDQGPGRDDDPPVRTGGDSLLYVMTTSGSTGRPRGVGVVHRGVVRLVRDPSYARLGPEETVLQLAPPAFDASTFEIWGALLNGATLAVFPPDAASLRELGAAVERAGATTLWLTAPLFRQMVDEELHSLRGVRQLLAGGDVLPAPQARRLAAELPGCRLVNGYGPTENTTFTCTWPVPATGIPGARVPIGRPVSGTRVYVLDRHGNPVPVGVPGELYVGGDGLARGYRNDPGLTARRFVPSPFEPGARLYRTGDRVRWRRDGDLEFLGRFDDQAKIRGFRVEPGETEAVLRECPLVKDCAVRVRPAGEGDRELVAYVVPRAGGAGDGGAGDGGVAAEPGGGPLPGMSGYLAARLPAYMLPSAWVVMDALPLNASGKVDRAALPDPGAWRAAAAGPRILPRNEVERTLAGMWSDLLQIHDGIGIHDNFFRLGGHSLLGTQLISRIRGVFQVELPLRSLFEAPTIGGLAAAVERERGLQPAAPVPIRARDAVNVDEMSDDEVEAMLRRLIDEGGAA
jgi:amino acid adenylation domain-containing protein